MLISMEGKRPQDWVNLILAVCLFISPWALGFAGETIPVWNAWIIGVILGVVAVAAISAFAEWEEWVNALLGVWLIIAPWALGFAASTHAMRTHVVLGVLTAAVSIWAVWQVRHTPRAA